MQLDFVHHIVVIKVRFLAESGLAVNALLANWAETSVECLERIVARTPRRPLCRFHEVIFNTESDMRKTIPPAYHMHNISMIGPNLKDCHHMIHLVQFVF